MKSLYRLSISGGWVYSQFLRVGFQRTDPRGIAFRPVYSHLLSMAFHRPWMMLPCAHSGGTGGAGGGGGKRVGNGGGACSCKLRRPRQPDAWVAPAAIVANAKARQTAVNIARRPWRPRFSLFFIV